jgi:alpha-methylacyl-CoA racemase
MTEQCPPTPCPLDGIRLVDFTRFGPGPWAAMMLGDLGADVLKVESPAGGTGRSQRLVGDDGIFTDWMNFARRNSRSILVDLKQPAGTQVARDLCRDADVVLESFRPGVADRLGLGAETLLADNPRLIYCSISGYGQTGPDARRAGHDLNYVATGGFLGATRSAEGRPTLPGTVVADLSVGAMYAVTGVLAALRGRDLTGAGQCVDVSMQEGIAHLMAPAIVEYLQTGTAPGPPDGYLYGGAPWYNVYEAADGRYVAVAAVEPWFFANLSRLLGHPEWTRSHSVRADWPRLRDELAAVFRTRSAAEWVDLLADEDTCVSMVNDIGEVVRDRQLASRAVYREQPDGHWEPAPLPRLSATPGRVRRMPSRPGEHSDEVLDSLGYSAADRASLAEAGVVS